MRGTEADDVRVIYTFAGSLATFPALLLEEQVMLPSVFLVPYTCRDIQQYTRMA